MDVQLITIIKKRKYVMSIYDQPISEKREKKRGLVDVDHAYG